ncbi:hypothetical protein SMU26_06971, partial [Streptococcus mutans 3SN1]
FEVSKAKSLAFEDLDELVGCLQLGIGIWRFKALMM